MAADSSPHASFLAVDDNIQRLSVYNDGPCSYACKYSAFPGEPASPPAPLVDHSSIDETYRLIHATSLKHLSDIGFYVFHNATLSGAANLVVDSKMVVANDLTPEYWRRMITSGQIVQGDTPSAAGVYKDPVLSIMSLGYKGYGHWLLDIMPRLWFYQHTVGAGYPVLVPADTPDFGIDFLRRLGINDEQFIRFDALMDAHLSVAITPSLLHNSYVFHSKFAEFCGEMVRRFALPAAGLCPKRIFVSRRRYLHMSAGENRALENEMEILGRVKRHDFSIVFPELLSFEEKVTLFSNADCIMGEFGSGMHLAMFSKPGTVIASIGIMNNVQSTIGAVCGHRNIYIKPHQNVRDGRREMTVPLIFVDEALDIIESL